jgi:5-methylcytosine-specific restriction endonuclease McrA
VFDLLNSGDVNLSTVGLVAPILNDKNKDLLLGQIKGKTQRQVESIVAGYKPPQAYRDRVRPVRVAVPPAEHRRGDRRNPLIFNSRCGSADRTNSGIVKPRDCEESDTDGTVGERSDAKIERRLLIQFLADEEFMAKLEEVKSLLSSKLPGAGFEDVFAALMDEFIDRHSPEKREERREKRSKQRKSDGKPLTEERKNRSRYIPVKIRDAVFKRDGGKCTYKGTNGRRCGSTWRLQIDHIKPFAMGGANTIDNLRLLCGRHNRLAAEKVYGRGFMEGHYLRE